MASASGCSIAGQSTFHTPSVSRHAEKGIRRGGRPGTPVPERAARPPTSSCHTKLRRTPRCNTASLLHNVSPPDEPHLRPTRRSRQIPGIKTLQSISSVARQREESPRKQCPSSAHDVKELRPTVSRIASTISSDIGIARSSVFPPRRSRKPRSTPSEQAVRRRPEYHRDIASEYERMANPYYSKHSTPASETHPRSCDSPVATPTARRVRTVDPISPASNRWSLSSDSSVSSTWSSSSSMVCPPTPTSDDGYVPRSPLYAREADYAWELEDAHREKELWRLRCLQMEDALGWTAERTPSIRSEDYQAPVYHDPGNIEEPLIDNSACFLCEEAAGQTTVYSNCDVIARDASFRRQMRNVNDPTHSSMTNLRKGSKSRRADDIEWEKGEEQRRRKRARPFPMWAEVAPREMMAKEMDGINIRFVPAPDDCSPVPGVRHVAVHEQLEPPNDHLPHQATSRGNSTKPSQMSSLRRKS